MTLRKLHGETSAEMREMFGRWYLQPLGESALGLSAAGPSRKPRKAPQGESIQATRAIASLLAGDPDEMRGPTAVIVPRLAIEALYLAVGSWPEPGAEGRNEEVERPSVRLRLIPSPDRSWSWPLVSHPSNPLFLTPPHGHASWDDFFASRLVSLRFSPHDSLDPSTLHTAFASFCKPHRSSRDSLTDAFAPVLRVVRAAPKAWERDLAWSAQLEEVGVMLHPELEDRRNEPTPSDPLRTLPLSTLLQAIGSATQRAQLERTRLEQLLTAAEAWLDHPDPDTERSLGSMVEADRKPT